MALNPNKYILVLVRFSSEYRFTAMLSPLRKKLPPMKENVQQMRKFEYTPVHIVSHHQIY